VAAVLVAGLSSAARPATPPAEAGAHAIRFDIPPQPLASAMEAFAAATGLQVLYDRPIGSDPRSPGVRGPLTPQAALRRLLEGSGLTARFTPMGDVVLAPEGVAVARPGSLAGPPPDLPRLSLDPLKVEGAPVVEIAPHPGGDPAAYARLIQSDIRQALASDPKTAHGDYVAVLDLRIGPAGEIASAAVARTSGEATRDADILAVVRGLALEAPPPAGLLQPVRIAVRARPRP